MTIIAEMKPSFELEVATYAKHALMPRTIEQRLLDRLACFKLQPQFILDLGSGLGSSTQALKQRYPKAKVMGVDLSHAMLKQAKQAARWWSKPGFIQADALALPFAPASVDLIFSNQLLPHLRDPKGFFQECQRVLKPWGCLLFSSLGPDTFKEIGPQALVDMHDLGDALLSTGFADPVMDREDLVLRYSSLDALITGLRCQGETAHLQVPPELWQAYPKDEGKWPLSYEILYGHAWRSERKPSSGEQTISWQTLKATLNKG